jgi:tetratricopeptide (TPR) repeat protein
MMASMTNAQSTDNAPAQQSMASARATKTTSVPKSWVCAFILVLITVLVYQPVWHAGFIWDDDSYVTNNTPLRTVDGLWGIWGKPGTTKQYYPLVFTSFWVEHHLWKLQPLGYHLVNVLLHALNAVLLWRVLRRLEIPGAWWAAAIFALHPVGVESVAWITERKNVLSGLFYFLAVLAYLRFRPLIDREAARACDWRYYPLVLVLFLCALLSKTVTCSLPAVLLLVVWWKTGRVERRDVLALAPLFVLGVASGFMTTWMEKHSVGASGAEWTLSFVQRGLVAGRALWFYAGKLFWPQQLTFIYPRWEIDASVAWQYLFPVAALVVLIALWRLRSRIGRGPLVAVVFFAGTLVPALGFFDVFPFRYSYVADHFQYLACIGLISLAVSMGTAICRRTGPWGRNLGTVAAAIVMLILGVSTWSQARIYQNLTTLWRDTVTKNPQCWVAHANLGDVFLREGKISDAIGCYEQALRIRPDYVEVHCNLGLALARVGKTQEAIEHYEQAVRIEPDFAMAHCNLGVALAQTGRIPEAIEHLQQALRIRPGYAEAHYNLGTALARLGRLPEAVGHWEQALRIKPDYAEVHYNLAVALIQLDRLPEAIEQYEQALRLYPNDVKAHYDLGLALVRLGRLPEAVGHWEQALRLKPDYAEAENNLAWLLATLAPTDGGDPVRAVTLAERACQLTNNRLAPYLDTLAAAYAAVGRFNDAIAAAQKAIELARSARQPQVLKEIELHLELYRAGRPYRER